MDDHQQTHTETAPPDGDFEPGSERDSGHRRRRRRSSSRATRHQLWMWGGRLGMLAVGGLVCGIVYLVFWVNSQRDDFIRASHERVQLQTRIQELEAKGRQIHFSELGLTDVDPEITPEPGAPAVNPTSVSALQATHGLRLRVPRRAAGLWELVLVDEQNRERAKTRARSAGDGIILMALQELPIGRYEIQARQLQSDHRQRYVFELQ